jgi:hypothetical protein
MKQLNKLKNSDIGRRKMRDQINILTAELKRARQISAHGPGIKTFSGVNGTQICIPRQYVPDSAIRRARTQEAATADGKISVKLLDSSGTVIGDAFDIYVFRNKEATDFTTNYYNSETGAVMASGDYVNISKLHGDWFLIAPLLINVDFCS